MTPPSVPPASPADAPPSAGSQARALEATRRVASQRRVVATLLTAAMIVVYFGFIALVAFRPAFLASPLGDGLTIGIVLGALVIVSAWLLTLTYVSWAHRRYDPALAALRAHPDEASAGRSA
ncbi:MAG: DUF485 domain-containing protein [Gemmatimonadetes bacterium]|nr:DUF485 domain-containing protein [Gemmatimonadota bacterium]